MSSSPEYKNSNQEPAPEKPQGRGTRRNTIQPRSSFCRCNRVQLDRPGLGVQRACDVHFPSREFLRRLLVAQRIKILAVIQTVHGAVDIDAGNRALGVRRPHSHMGMICDAHVVRNDAGERVLARSCGQHCDCK